MTEDTRLLVVFFDDIRGSTALKEHYVKLANEAAFHAVRKEHDDLVSSIIGRDGAGQVIKSTGDGFLAIFEKPSIAVERAMEIQERLQGHAVLSIRIGLDLGEVRVEYEHGRVKDVFGRHVDWAARVAGMADGGHVCMTKSVYTDAVSWATQGRIAWKDHGRYRVKPGEPPLEVYEAYNANVKPPMDALNGEQVDVSAPLDAEPARRAAIAAGEVVQGMRLVKPWESVARDGREFADGSLHTTRVPDAVIRVHERDEKALLHSLNLVANQWDSLFE